MNNLEHHDNSVTTILHPAPQRAWTRNGGPATASAPLTARREDSLPEQGFTIRAGDGRIELGYADEAGRRYGERAVAQLRRDPLIDTAAFTVEDWPDFPTRAFMLDISRDRVLGRDGLRRLVATLSTARYNQLEIYTEHTFAFTGHETVWGPASPMTADDIRWLDSLCAAEGIALVPNQNCLGHMERWLKHPGYVERAESPEGMDLVSERLPATTLAPTEDNVRFVSTLLDEVVPLFGAKRMNIGCDEPWELGHGVSRDKAEAVGLGRVYTDYVAAVMQPWIDRGYEIEYWADVAANHPGALERLPAGAIPVVWMYNSPHMMKTLVARNDAEEEAGHAAHGIVMRELVNGFRDRAAALIDGGIPFWVAPGTNAWRSMTGRLDEAVRNFVDAAEVGLENSSSGYLVTSWGNQGAWDPPAVSVPPIAAGGAIGWSLAANRDIELPEVLNRWYFDDAADVLGRVVCDVGHVPELLECPILNTSPLWVVLQSGGNLPPKQTPAVDKLQSASALLLQRRSELDSHRAADASQGVVTEELRHVIDVAVLGIDVILAGTSSESDPTPSEAASLLARLERILIRQAQVWTESSRYGGLADSLAEFEPLRVRLQTLAAKQHVDKKEL